MQQSRVTRGGFTGVWGRDDGEDWDPLHAEDPFPQRKSTRVYPTRYGRFRRSCRHVPARQLVPRAPRRRKQTPCTRTHVYQGAIIPPLVNYYLIPTTLTTLRDSLIRVTQIIATCAGQIDANDKKIVTFLTIFWCCLPKRQYNVNTPSGSRVADHLVPHGRPARHQTRGRAAS